VRLAVTGSATISELRSRWHEVTHLERSQLAIGAALPSAIGYAIPLVAGLATGHLADGVAASAGALIVGFANLGGSYRVRGMTLLVTTLSSGLAALLGGLAGPSVAATAALLAAWGFAGGMLVALGRRAAFVGMLSTWALLLAGDLHLHGEAVVREAWLLTAGGLVQTLVALVAWPLRPLGPERRAVADAYRALADYARAPASNTLQSAAAALASAADTVGSRVAAGGDRGALRGLVEIGEWIRVEMVVLARSAAPEAEPVLSSAAASLEAIGARRRPEASLTVLAGAARAVSEPSARRAAASLAGWIWTAATERAEDLDWIPAPLAALDPGLVLERRRSRTAAIRAARRPPGPPRGPGRRAPGA
jgi:hypothetical protein